MRWKCVVFLTASRRLLSTPIISNTRTLAGVVKAAGCATVDAQSSRLAALRSTKDRTFRFLKLNSHNKQGKKLAMTMHFILRYTYFRTVLENDSNKNLFWVIICFFTIGVPSFCRSHHKLALLILQCFTLGFFHSLTLIWSFCHWRVSWFWNCLILCHAPGVSLWSRLVDLIFIWKCLKNPLNHETNHSPIWEQKSRWEFFRNIFPRWCASVVLFVGAWLVREEEAEIMQINWRLMDGKINTKDVSRLVLLICGFDCLGARAQQCAFGAVGVTTRRCARHAVFMRAGENVKLIENSGGFYRPYNTRTPIHRRTYTHTHTHTPTHTE